MEKEYVFKLYLTGRTPRNEQGIANLKNFLDDEFKDQYSLEIIYVTEDSAVAHSAKIICTPTLIKELPPPPRRVVGNFTDKEKVLAGLRLSNQ